MIKLIENKSTNNRRKRYHLLVDKELIKAKIRSFTRDEELLINVSTNDFSAVRILSKYKFQDYPNLNYISLSLNLPEAIYLAKVGITYNAATKRYELKFRYTANLNIWKDRENYLRFYGIYSNLIAELNYSQSDIAKRFNQSNLNPEISSISQRSGFEISFSVHSLENSLLDEIKSYSTILIEYHLEALNIMANLKKFENSEIIETIFNFPLSLKITCEQYLLYFARFLQDLGINATSNLKEEAGKVLFSVMPTDDVEALDKIREALAVFFNLPSSPIVYDDSFAAMRLQQQVENLQHSQRMTEREIRSSERELRLAQTIIENQDRVIVQKDTLIEQQNRVLEKITSKSIMMDSLENKAEFEKVFDGLEFGESKELKEKLGIKFNPITSLKSLGKKLSGDDEITSLNLNEETDKNN
jgi:hypothetical protein